MRLQFKGYYSTKALKAAFEHVLDELFDNDIDGLANVNMYFRPHSDGCEVSLKNRHGEKLEHLVVENPTLFSQKVLKTKSALIKPYGEMLLDDAE